MLLSLTMRSLLEIASQPSSADSGSPVKITFMSFKSSIAIGFSSGSPLSLRAALRARLGHSPPARSAMAKSGIQLSGSRSLASERIAGSDFRSVARLSAAHLAAFRCRIFSSGYSLMTDNFSTRSRFVFRCIFITIERDAVVSGRLPIRARHFAAHVQNRVGS